MFDVELRVLCVRRNAFAEFARYLKLPIPPSPGLIVRPDADDDGRSEWLASVAWLSDEQRFLCRLPDDCGDSEDEDEVSAFDSWRSRGWEVLRQGRLIGAPDKREGRLSRPVGRARHPGPRSD
jgi:hypothetical protein